MNIETKLIEQTIALLEQFVFESSSDQLEAEAADVITQLYDALEAINGTQTNEPTSMEADSAEVSSVPEEA